MSTIVVVRYGVRESVVDTNTCELIAVDEGVPVLIYATVSNTSAGLVLDSFNIDRLDGELLLNYPEAGDSLMIVEENKRIGMADLRHLYGGSHS